MRNWYSRTYVDRGLGRKLGRKRRQKSAELCRRLHVAKTRKPRKKQQNTAAWQLSCSCELSYGDFLPKVLTHKGFGRKPLALAVSAADFAAQTVQFQRRPHAARDPRSNPSPVVKYSFYSRLLERRLAPASSQPRGINEGTMGITHIPPRTRSDIRNQYSITAAPIALPAAGRQAKELPRAPRATPLPAAGPEA